MFHGLAPKRLKSVRVAKLLLFGSQLRDESIFTCDVTSGEEGSSPPFVVNFRACFSCEIFLRTVEFLHLSRDSITIFPFDII